MTAGAVGAVADLMVAIADAETRADRAFFADLLHERFVMLRPNGMMEGRDGFLGRLAAGGERETELLSVEVYGSRRAVASAIVRKRADAGAPWDTHHNLRVFLLDPDDGRWRLVSWLNEPHPTAA